MYFSTVVGRSPVQRVLASCALFANEILASRLCEWSRVFNSSCFDDGGYSSGYTWLDMGCHLCKEWKSIGYDFNPCHVEFKSVSGQLAGTLNNYNKMVSIAFVHK